MGLHWKGAVNSLPRLDPHRLRDILCGGLPCRRVWNRIIRREVWSGVIRRGTVYISVGLQPPSPDFFLSRRQLFQPVDRPLCSRPGGGLGAVDLGVLPPPALGGVPELTPQFFHASEKTAPKELLRRGLDLFFCLF